MCNTTSDMYGLFGASPEAEITASSHSLPTLDTGLYFTVLSQNEVSQAFLSLTDSDMNL